MIPHILDQAAKIPAGDGTVLLAGALQGRIFAAMDGELLHRLDVPLAENPSPDFNNLGGNSLWPAPEGGPFAFNYPCPDGPWRVQDGINSVRSAVLADGCTMEKTIELENRKGSRSRLTHRRSVSAAGGGFGKQYGVRELVYCCRDSLELSRPLPVEEFVISAWSLEQFDLTPEACGIGTAQDVPGAVNTDFYGDPGPYLCRKGGSFCFRFQAPARLQIGISEKADPGFIGAYVPEKELLILRRIRRADAGKRINFADNDQPQGVWSACDQYSIFYGPDARFFEVETLAPVRIADGKVSGSCMETETHFYRGPQERLAALLTKEFHFNTEVWK